MLKDIEMAKQLKADGVVFGCLTAEGEIDLTIMQELMKAAQGLSVTFHRAFDVCRDPKKALEQIIALGCNRILRFPSTNQLPNQASLCSKNYKSKRQEGLSYLQDAASMEKNIHRIASETWIREFHFSARENIKSGMNYKNESVSMGGTVHIDEYERNVTTARRVMDTIQATNKE